MLRSPLNVLRDDVVCFWFNFFVKREVVLTFECPSEMLCSALNILSHMQDTSLKTLHFQPYPKP
jgi:hypothetical protein